MGCVSAASTVMGAGVYDPARDCNDGGMTKHLLKSVAGAGVGAALYFAVRALFFDRDFDLLGTVIVAVVVGCVIGAMSLPWPRDDADREAQNAD